MATLRALVEADLPQVADLHRRTFVNPGAPSADQPSDREYAAYLRDVFLTGPHPGSGFSSLVAEDGQHIVGFLGVVPRQLCAGPRRIWACVCTQFAVAPEHRGLVGLRLIRHLFDGPQDLSITDEANDATRRLWMWAGAETLVTASLHWIRPLRPGRLATSALPRRLGWSAVRAASAPVAGLLDAAAARVPHSPLRQRAPSTVGEELDAEAMIDGLPALTAAVAVRPVYEPASLAWTLARAGGAAGRGPLRRVRVRSADGEPLGWFLYHARAGGTGDVLQVAAAEPHVRAVLDHLFFDAWQRGVAALSGRADPRHLQAYSDRWCLFTRRGPWAVGYARDSASLAAFHRGDAFFSRLDGEWCARMR
jgi:hypothetical protein